MSIIIFSKPIHSGKTTELMKWSKMQQSCFGILMPDVDGLRKMYDIASQSYFNAECKKLLIANEELSVIGKYSFYQSSFDKANQIVEEASLLKPEFIVIDEVGKLELEKEGFYASLKKLIDISNTNSADTKIIVAIRDVFVAEVIAGFNILNYKIVDSLTKLNL